MANLTQAQAKERRNLRREFFRSGGVLSWSQCGRVVVALLPDVRKGRVALMATSICSPRETHIITPIGELHALRRLNDGQFSLVPWPSDRDEQWSDAEMYADIFANRLD